jgi:hypothetical protein
MTSRSTVVENVPDRQTCSGPQDILRSHHTLKRSSSLIHTAYNRGGQLDQLREQHFSRQQLARDMYSTLKFIKSKYRSVLTDEHLTEPVRTALTTYQPNFKKLAAYPELYFVLKTRTLLKASSASSTSHVHEPHAAREPRCCHPWDIEFKLWACLCICLQLENGHPNLYQIWYAQKEIVEWSKLRKIVLFKFK